MKKKAMLRLAFGMMCSTIVIAGATASEKGLTASGAEKAVLRQAHTFISKNAPDFGGSVKSPCFKDSGQDLLEFVCSGETEMTIGGGGSVKIPFECTGEFAQKDGLFYQTRPIECRETL
jgi:hypothetical protein